ncbi:MAG: type I-C CRISPR-associated endonuclease Cas1c [Trueperaceae bacterium]
MKQVLNTLYVQTQGSYLRLDHDTLKIDVEGKTPFQIPLHHLSGLVIFGNVLLSPFLIHRCGDDGRSIVWLTQSGRFKARLFAPTSGNVLLRRAQHAALDSADTTLELAKYMVAGKLQNARTVLLRNAREGAEAEVEQVIRTAARVHADAITHLPRLRYLDEVRGAEGDAAKAYFAVFDHMIRTNKDEFVFSGRNRRPPRDRVNALLSFVYGMLRNECVSALEGVGLDPQVGFLHALRPGRPALALDLMEELRAPLADRLVLTLINLGQVRADGFVARPGGAVELTEESRKTVAVAYQKRKQDEVTHPVLAKPIPFGLVAHTQARLLARHLRGDVPNYRPFLYR